MQELWVHEQQMPTIVCGWGLVKGTVDSWHKCDTTFLWWWSNTCHLIKKAHLRYTIHNPTSYWACCNYVNAHCGNICKHQLKVLMLLHLDLAEGTIVWFCGLLKATFEGGVKDLLSPQVGIGPFPHIMTIPPTSIHKLTTPTQVNLEEQLWSMALNMVDVASGNQVFL